MAAIGGQKTVGFETGGRTPRWRTVSCVRVQATALINCIHVRDPSVHPPVAGQGRSDSPVGGDLEGRSMSTDAVQAQPAPPARLHACLGTPPVGASCSGPSVDARLILAGPAAICGEGSTNAHHHTLPSSAYLLRNHLQRWQLLGGQ